MEDIQSKLYQRHARGHRACEARVLSAMFAIGAATLFATHARAADSKTKAIAQAEKADARAASSTAPAASEASLLGVGLGLFVEDSERTQQSLIGGQEPQEREPEELVSASVFNIQVWYLRPLLVPGLRWGGGVAWFSGYSLEEPDADDDAEPYAAGHMFQIGLQGEYELSQVVSNLGVILGLRAGGALLFPGQDLQAELDALERRGLDVWGGPQPGVYVAPLLGVRWPLSARVNLRADISAQFAKLWLYSAEGEAEGITSEQSAVLTTTRTQLLIGLDFSL